MFFLVHERIHFSFKAAVFFITRFRLIFPSHQFVSIAQTVPGILMSRVNFQYRFKCFFSILIFFLVIINSSEAIITFRVILILLYSF